MIPRNSGSYYLRIQQYGTECSERSKLERLLDILWYGLKYCSEPQAHET